MAERLRALLERPLGEREARAVLVAATVAFLGFAAVAILALGAAGPAPRRAAPRHAPTAPARVAAPPLGGPGSGRPAALRSAQDPQDRPGSAAARRAARELGSHRALQHVPYRSGGLAITLLGAARGKAILRVAAPSRAAARRGWSAFLRRYRDAGSAYRVRFAAGRRRDG